MHVLIKYVVICPRILRQAQESYGWGRGVFNYVAGLLSEVEAPCIVFVIRRTLRLRSGILELNRLLAGLRIKSEGDTMVSL